MPREAAGGEGCQTSAVPAGGGGRTEWALERSRSIYRSIGHIKRILLTRMLSENLILSMRQRM